MNATFWDWTPLAGGGFELKKEGRRVLTLDAAGAIRGLATPAGAVVGDLAGPFTGAVRFSSTAYIATLEFAGCRLRVRSGDRVTRVDGSAPGITLAPVAGLTLPPASGACHRTAVAGRSGVCLMESGDSRCICAFDDPASFDPDLALAAFTATKKD